jgi:DNA-binding PadR family transcriptional regulator
MQPDTRLTPTSYIVLGLLDALGEATPYDLKQLLAASVGNFWTVQHSALYAEPERLAAGGYVSERREQGGRRRRRYRITAKGRRALREWAAEPTADFTELRDSGCSSCSSAPTRSGSPRPSSRPTAPSSPSTRRSTQT